MKSLKLYWYNLASKPPRTVFGWILLSLLWLVSLIYRIATAKRNFLYKIGLFRSIKLPCKVISVGNITVGGTGKTPMVEYLAKEFVKQNKKVVILSRGYGRIDGVKDDEASSFSDKSIIRLTGSNRAKLGAIACKEHSPDVIILDDGFQHLRIKRDIDIVMIDCLSPFGNYQLLPAGILREDLKALKRASVLVLAHSDLVQDTELSEINNSLSRFGKPIIKSIHKPIILVGATEKEQELNAEAIKGKKVWAFCGIGNPDSFLLTLNKLGISLRGFTLFPDHYMYVESDINELIRQSCEANAEYIVTTMKDMAKVKSQINNPQIPIYALRIELEVTGGKTKLEELIK